MAAVAAITACFGVSAYHVEVTSSLDELFPEHIERRLREHGQSRTERDFLIVAAESDNAFAPEALTALESAILQIETLEEVTGSVTPFNLMAFGRADSGRVTIGPIAPGGRAPRNTQDAELLKRRLLDDPASRKLLVSSDGRTIGALFNVPLRDDYQRLFDELDIITAPLSEYYDIRWGGNPTFDYRLKQRITEDLPRLMIAAIAVIMISYYVTFRAVRAVVMPLLVVVAGTLWTVGTMRVLGMPFTITSIMTPPLVLSLGSAYSVHVMTYYYAGAGRHGSQSGVVQAMSRVTATIVLAALTTIIGFSSLLTGSLVQVREFGLITAFGIAYCALLSLFFLPACLSLLPPPSRVHRTEQGPRVLRALSRLGQTRWKYLVIAGAVALAAVCFASLPRLRYDTDVARMFGRDSRVVQDNLFVVQELVGALDVNITLTAPEQARRYFLDPERLRYVAELEHALRQDPDVAYVSSFVTQISRMNLAARGTYEVPLNRALVGVFATMLNGLSESDSSPDMLLSTIDEAGSSVTVNVRITDAEDGGSFVKEQDYRATIGRIEDFANDILPAEFGVNIWSNGMAILEVSDSLLIDHMRSAIVSVVLVFLVTALGFRSLRYGALALIPVVVGLMTNLTLMAFSRIPLDAVTMALSALSIGVGVDHAIHLLLAYRRERRPETTTSTAISLALVKSGRSILVGALSLAAGLLVLVTSTFPPIAVVGLLLAVLVLSTLAGSLVVLPVVMGLTREGTRESSTC